MNTTEIPQKAHSNSRDFFLYVLMLITLYMATGALISILFEFVNRLIPDTLTGLRGASLSTVRSSLSVLVVSFPFFMTLAWFLRKDVVAHPEKKEVGIRKFSLYLTIFVTAILLMADMIVLFNNFFDGELTANVFSKIALVLVVIGGVMAYFLHEVKRPVTAAPSRVLAFGVSGGVVAVVVASFVIFGSPFTQRLLRFDAQRVQHLSQMQQEVFNHWSNNKKLPEKASDLENDLTGFRISRDPVTGKSYQYEKLDEGTFELCTTFDLASTLDKADNYYIYSGPYGYDQSSDYWSHDSGYQCFVRKTSSFTLPTVPGKY